LAELPRWCWRVRVKASWPGLFLISEKIFRSFFAECIFCWCVCGGGCHKSPLSRKGHSHSCPLLFFWVFFIMRVWDFLQCFLWSMEMIPGSPLILFNVTCQTFYVKAPRSFGMSHTWSWCRIFLLCFGFGL
jgi:hypothetical protein